MRNVISINEIRRARHQDRVAFAPTLERDSYLRLPVGTRRRVLPNSGWQVEYAPADEPETALGRTSLRLFLWRTEADVFEQEIATDLVLMNDKVVWPQAPVAFGAPRSGRLGEIVLGEEAALLFVTRDWRGWHVRIRTSGPVIEVGATPRCIDTGPALAGDWLAIARESREAALK